MANVSDLTLGEKLALKGQLFELRKKLNAIELQNQQTETYSFRPALVTEYYELPDRENSYVKNVERAEQMRRQKLDMLRTTLEMEQTSELTFSPNITKKSRRIAEIANSQPGAEQDVGRRLYNQHARMQESKARQSENVKQFDPRTGQRMFSPLISAKSKALVPAASNELDAHEFMYRDAVEREERLRQQELRAREEAERTAAKSKLNNQSDRILKQRAERETRALFDYLDQENRGTVSYDDIAAAAHTLVARGLLTINASIGQSSHSVADRVWRILLEHPRQDLSELTPIAASTKNETSIGKQEQTASDEEAAQSGLSGRLVGLEAFTKRVLPVAARGFLGAQFDSRELYESTITDSHGDTRAAIIEDLTEDLQAQPSTPTRASYHIPRTKDHDVSSAKKAEHGHTFKPVIFKSDIPKSLTTAKTAALPVKKASLGTTPKPANKIAQLQLRHLESGADVTYLSEEGEKTVRLEDIPVHGRIAPVSPKRVTPVISNSNEAVIPSAYAVFRTFILALITLLKAHAHDASVQSPISSLHAKVHENAVKASALRIEGGGTFSPNIPDRSRKLALTKEEREAALLVQKAIDDDALLNGRSGDTNKTKSSLEMMLERARVSEERKQQHKVAALEEELRECTFQPKINRMHIATSSQVDLSALQNTSKPTVVNPVLGQIYEYNSDTPAHERLYAMKDKSARSTRIVHKTKEEIELEECTFSPKLAPYSRQGSVSTAEYSSEPPPRPPGWDEAVQRLRNAAAARTEVDDDEKQPESLDERYARARRAFAKGPKEFQFKTDERSRKRAARQEAHSKPRLYIDVKLSAFRTANIPVYDFDNPLELARRFCKIFSFPPQAHVVLEEVIRQSMESNSIRISEEGDNDGDNDEEHGDVQDKGGDAIASLEEDVTQDPQASIGVSMGSGENLSLLPQSLDATAVRPGVVLKNDQPTTSRTKIRLRVTKDRQEAPTVMPALPLAPVPPAPPEEEGSFFRSAGGV
jgi:hypothetical protein